MTTPTVALCPTAGILYQAFTSGGLPLNAGLLYTYIAGGTTPQATYTTSAGTVANANPIVLNADGRPPNEIWLDISVSYRFDLYDSASNLIKSYDNIPGPAIFLPSGVTPEQFGAVGNTNFYNGSSWWADAGFTIPAHDDTAAINAAIASLSSNAIPILFSAGKNYGCTGIAFSGGLKAATFKGEGGGGYGSGSTLPTIVYTGSSGVLFDFTACTNEPIFFENLLLTSGRTAAATTGTGIKVGNQNNGATLCRLHNVIVTYFNVGFQITANGFNFYSDFQEVIFQNNYQYGFFADAGALLNHSTFTACIFSLTTKPANGGYGFYAVSTGSGMSFRGCYFESNTANGAYFQGTQVANFDGCYFEANLQEDIKINNLYPAINSRLRVENCYIAPSAKLYNKVYLYGCKVFAANNALFGSADNTYPPFFFYPNTGNGGAGNSPAGENISTFVNNSYDAPTLTNIDSSVIIHDSKHGAVTSGAGPAYSTTNTGSFMFNTDTTTNQKVLGWFTRSGGRVNTPLVKNFAGTQITGTTTSGSSIIVLNITTDSPLYEGDYIKMAGVTWNTGSTSVRIEEINTNGDPVTQFSADNSLGPVNMVWRDAVFNSVGNVQGTYTAWSPTLTLSSVAPTTMTYTAGTVGKYVLVGALVYFEGTIVINAFTLGAGAGSIEVNLPPFTGLALSPATFTIGQSSGFVTNQPSLTTYDSTSRFYLSYRATANGASAVMTAAELQANATFSFSGYYLVA